MKQIRGNLWMLGATADAIVITTNGRTTRSGLAIMGKGTAAEAANRYQPLRKLLGEHLEREGNHVGAFQFFIGHKQWIVSFPTKEEWRMKSNLDLIERSANELVQIANKNFWSRVVMPRPGCGSGGLEWKKVWPVIAPLLDDRFIVVNR